MTDWHMFAAAGLAVLWMLVLGFCIWRRVR